jgi:hypothetical protein
LRWGANDRWALTGSVVFQDLESAGNTEHTPDSAGDLQQVRFIEEFRDDQWTQFGLR